MRGSIVLVSIALQGSVNARNPDEDCTNHEHRTHQPTRRERLRQRAGKLPDVRRDLAEAASEAALAVEVPGLDAELLVAIAWGESRFDPRVVTGRACGPMQTIPTRRVSCRQMQTFKVGFAAGVAELLEWRADKRTRGDLRLVLLAQACGSSAFNGTCRKKRWPDWVLRRAKALTD